jgi:MFS family permease
VAVVGTLGLNYRVALPLLARFTFGGDASVYGLLASIMAAGSVVGALAAARRGRPSQALLLWSVAVFGVLSVAAAAAPTLALEMVVLAPLGLASIAFLATANSTIQLSSSPELRGRVMALYGLVFLGSTPVGALLAGWMADRFGPRSIMLLAGVSSLAAAGVAAVLLRDRKPAATPGRSGPAAAEAQTERW